MPLCNRTIGCLAGAGQLGSKDVLEFDSVRIEKEYGVIAGFVLRIVLRRVEDLSIHLQQCLVEVVDLLATVSSKRQMVDSWRKPIVFGCCFAGLVETD